MTTNTQLCARHRIAIYQVGEVFGNAPPDVLQKFFVSVIDGDFPDIDVTAIPLGDTYAQAEQIAVQHLGLANDSQPCA